MPEPTTRRAALVTGGGSGIGRATALLLSRDGLSVCVTGRRVAMLERTCGAILDSGGQAASFAADLREEEEAEGAVAHSVAAFGRIDVLVNAAGLFVPGSVPDLSLSAWREAFDGNLTTAFLTTRATLPRMIEQGGGVIVNVTSTLASRAIPNAAAYCAAKGALENLTRAIAIDHAKQGVRAVAVAPAIVDTAMGLRGKRRDDPELRRKLDLLHPAGRIGKPEEVASFIAALCREEAAWITGSVHVIDGGLMAKG